MPSRVTPGQKLRKFPGGTWRDLCSLLTKQGQLAPPPGPTDNFRRDTTPMLVVPFVNETGQDLVERAIVGISEAAFEPPVISEGSSPPYDDSNEADAGILAGVPVVAVLPDAVTHANKWAVTLGPVAEGDTGFCAIMGLVWARVDVTDPSHTHATPVTGDTVYLTSGTSGAKIWHAEESPYYYEGEINAVKQWCQILLGGGSTGAELVGEVSLSLETIAAIEAVDYYELDPAVQAAIDPDGHLELLEEPRVFRMGTSLAHRHHVYKVNEGTDESPSYEYYIVPLYEDPGGAYSGPYYDLTPLTVRVANMSDAIAADHLMQTKSVNRTSGGSSGGFGGEGADSNSPIVGGVIDVVACSPAPSLSVES